MKKVLRFILSLLKDPMFWFAITCLYVFVTSYNFFIADCIISSYRSIFPYVVSIIFSCFTTGLYTVGICLLWVISRKIWEYLKEKWDSIY